MTWFGIFVICWWVANALAYIGMAATGYKLSAGWGTAIFSVCLYALFIFLLVTVGV